MASLIIQPKAELESQLRFKTVLNEISTFFISLPAEKIDSSIEAAQARVCEFLGLDRSTLFQVPDEAPGTLLLTHVFQPPESRIPPERMNVKDYWPWTLKKVLRGETITLSKMSELPAEAGRDRENFDLYGTRSIVGVPLAVGEGPVFGLLTFAVMDQERCWTEKVVADFRLIAQVFANALTRKRMEEQLKRRLREIEEFKGRLEEENLYLKEEVKLLVAHTEIVGQSLAMRKVLNKVEQVAKTDSTVLLLWGNRHRKGASSQGHPPHEHEKRPAAHNGQLRFTSPLFDRK